MSRHKFLEKMAHSRVNYWVTVVCDLSGAVFFLFYGVSRWSSGWLASLVAVVLGYLVWGYLEYVLHRWILHGPKTVAQEGHARHHVEARALVSTPFFVITGGALVIFGLLRLAIPVDVASLTVFGIYSGYNYFALLHHAEHHFEWDIATPYFGRLREIHEIHHLRPRTNFGTTTSLWDRVFGTFLSRV
ncbi:MAG: sterol desaturase family protein [Acidobacteriota bacterium]|nr:MAG: sterol desaturase family protein [Acidobacteriota bacterium]